MASTLVRRTRESLCKEAALRCDLKDEKVPALEREAGRVREVVKSISRQKENRCRVFPTSRYLWVVAETSHLTSRLCFTLYDLL